MRVQLPCRVRFVVCSAGGAYSEHVFSARERAGRGCVKTTQRCPLAKLTERGCVVLGREYSGGVRIMIGILVILLVTAINVSISTILPINDHASIHI